MIFGGESLPALRRVARFGNGWFGGGVPAIGTALALSTGVALSALFYPMAIAAIGVVVSRAGQAAFDRARDRCVVTAAQVHFRSTVS